MASPANCPDCERAAPPGQGGCVRCLAALFTPADALPDLPGLAVVRLVGRGGFGAVYEACDPARGRVAVKVLHGGRGADRGERDRFRREFDAVRGLRHPGIVGVHDFAEDADRVWFTMNYLEGGSLADELAERPPVAVAVGYARELAASLAFAHDRGVCHRDLKPSNVMLDAGGRPVVVDFGLATGIGDRPPVLREEVRGYTLGYTAPECRPGAEPGANPVAADVYSFGAVLYHTLSGPPVPDGELAFPRAVSRDLRAVCRKCLAADPQKRYRRMADAVADLDAVAARRPVAARPLWLPVRGWRAVRRHPVVSAVSALLVGALSAGGHQWRERAAAQTLQEQEWRNRDTADAARAEAEGVARLADDADAAFRTGRWGAAAEGYTAAILRDHPDRGRLKIRRLQSWFAGSRVAEFQAELAALGDDPHMVAHCGQLLLLRAELEFLDPLKTTAGRELTQQAVAAGGLSPVDVAYADGLLADSTLDMLARFEEAATRDPTHYRSQAALTVGLLVTGRYADAKARAHFVRGLFPDDLLPDFADGFADLLDGRPDVGVPQLDRVADRLGGGRGDYLRTHSRALARQLDAVRKMNARAGMGAAVMVTEKGAGERAGFSAGLAKMYSPDGFPLGVPSPVVSRLFEPGLAYVRAAQLLLGSKDARKAGELAEAALARDPDASLAAFASGVRFVAAQGLSSSKKPEDRAKLEAELRRIVDLGQLATECPSRYAGGSFRYEGRAYAVVAIACLAREDDFPAAAKEFRAKLLAAFPKLVAEGAAFPVMRRDVIQALVTTKLLDAYSCRALLAAWAAAAAEMDPWELLVRVELGAGNPVAARDAADRVLATFPNDTALKARVDQLFQPAMPIPEARP